MTHPLVQYFQDHPGETRKSLALRADVSRMQIWRLIKGEGEFSSAFLRKVSRATYGAVSVAQLAGAVEATKQEKKSAPLGDLARAS